MPIMHAFKIYKQLLQIRQSNTGFHDQLSLFEAAERGDIDAIDKISNMGLAMIFCGASLQQFFKRP